VVFVCFCPAAELGSSLVFRSGIKGRHGQKVTLLAVANRSEEKGFRWLAFNIAD